MAPTQIDIVHLVAARFDKRGKMWCGGTFDYTTYAQFGRITNRVPEVTCTYCQTAFAEWDHNN